MRKDDITIRHALRRYRRDSQRKGYRFPDPSAESSSVDGQHVVLRNRHGEVARYRWDLEDGGRVRLEDATCYRRHHGRWVPIEQA